MSYTYYQELTRIYKSDKQTLGQIDVVCDQTGQIVFTCFSLELPDLNNDGIENNERQKSCIADGEYPMTKENHKKFGWCYRIHDVKGRDGVLEHSGTNFDHTLGCILPATDQKDLNADGHLDNTASKKALAQLVKYNTHKIVIWTRP